MDLWGRGEVFLTRVVDHLLVRTRLLGMSRCLHRLNVCLLDVDRSVGSGIEVLGPEREIEGVLLDSVRGRGGRARRIGERACLRGY